MIRVSKLKEGPSRTRFLSLEELEKLFEACENSSDQNLLPITKLAALTGMRMGEILGLKVGAVNWSQKVILLERTKNGDKRLIPITPAVEEVLNRCLDPSSLQDEFIFKTSRKNTKYRAGMIRLSFAKACKESGLTGIRLHDLRRTYCSWAGMSGCTQMELQEMLGHRSPHMTKIYLRYSKSHIASQMQRAQEKIMGGSNEND
jgi:integrase